LKILIVDADERIRAAITELIDKPHWEFLEANDGAEGILQYRTHRPDWVIMDVEMPNMDGLSATLAIQKEFPEAQVIILTLHNSPRLRRAAFAAGAREFVDKEDLTKLSAFLTAPPA
jgi:two-component system response regulator DegU